MIEASCHMFYAMMFDEVINRALDEITSNYNCGINQKELIDY